MKKGVLAVISGFSGTGKGTVVERLVSEYAYALSISATTRLPREGEKDGVNYFFKSKEEFEKMIAEDAFVEYAVYVDNYYGTPKSYVKEQLNKGKNVLLEIEMQGALKVKEKFPEASLVFLAPPSAEELKKRLINRGTESEEVIAKRIRRAKEECVYIDKYDYIIINDDLDRCVEEVHGLLQMLRCTSANQKEFIEDIVGQLQGL